MDEQQTNENKTLSGDDITCPNCSSHNVRCVPYSKVEFGAWFILWLVLAFGGYMISVFITIAGIVFWSIALVIRLKQNKLAKQYIRMQCISYDLKRKPSIKLKIREPTPEQKLKHEEDRFYKVLVDYFHHLKAWRRQYEPKQPADEWHPLFVEALQKESYVEYLLGTLVYGTPEEKKALIAEQRTEVMKLEQRFANPAADSDYRRSKKKSGLDR